MLKWEMDEHGALSDGAPLILLIGENREETGFDVRSMDCALCRVTVEDWNRQLSPWTAAAVFRGGEAFGSGAEAFLGEVLEALPDMLGRVGQRPARIAGYSLAGLFALFATLNTEAFDAAACMSPSVWFPGFDDYLKARISASAGKRYYLSLGRQEERTRNPVMRLVGDRLREAQALLAGATGAETPLIWHDGGHFADVPKRIEAGVRWLAELRK